MTTAIRPSEFELVVFATMQYTVEPSADKLISSGWAEQHHYSPTRVHEAYERLSKWGLIIPCSEADRAWIRRYEPMRHLAGNPEQVDAIPRWAYADPHDLWSYWRRRGVHFRPSSIELILYATMQHWNLNYVCDADSFAREFRLGVKEVVRANDNLVAYGLVIRGRNLNDVPEHLWDAEWVVNGYEFVMPNVLPWWGKRLTRATLAQVAK